MNLLFSTKEQVVDAKVVDVPVVVEKKVWRHKMDNEHYQELAVWVSQHMHLGPVQVANTIEYHTSPTGRIIVIDVSTVATIVHPKE